MQNTTIPNVKKIAVLRANALGDFIVTLPALTALKETYPNAELVLLGKKWHKDFLVKGRSPVDRVIVVPPIKGITETDYSNENQGEISRFFEKMQQEQFDIAIHFQGDGKSSNPFLHQLGAKITVGMKSPDAENIDRFIPYVYYQSEVLRYLDVASLIGAMTTQLEPQITILNNDITELNKFYTFHKPYIVIHPGADDMRRQWSVEKFAEVASTLTDLGYQIVITGTGAESDLAARISHAVQSSVIDATNKVSLHGLTALLGKAQLVIANDTGPLHLARAVGAKTVGIYWGPNVLNWGPFTRTRHRVVVSWDLICPHCKIIPTNPWPFQPYFPECTHMYSFVKNISVEDVLKESLDLLQS